MLSEHMRKFYHYSLEKHRSSPPSDDPMDMVERSAALINFAIKKDLDDDEFMSCLEHLCKVAKKFDKTKAQWQTYAVTVIRRYYYSIKKQEYERKNKCDIIYTSSTEDKISVIDLAESKRTIDNDVELRDEIKHLMAHVDDLPQIEREIIYAKFGLGGGQPASLSAIAQMKNRSKEYIRYIQDRALKMLREKMINAQI